MSENDTQETQTPNRGQLERTLGLKAALAIGVGTMVGAGIFVFPGIAAGDAGPAAMVSFALGGMIALLVALSTAELATAMPASGGGYFFVSRTFGPLWGMVVGVGQWVGLVFASSFYLVGFGQYAIDLLAELGISLGEPVVLIALGTALILTLINLFGTEGAGDLQNGIVVLLTIILGMLFGYGALNALGVIGQPQWPLPFAPKGIAPIFSTTALIFTSYLGFVQIATVGGEIKAPQHNLPRALMGSVLIAMTLYIVAIFVSTSVLSTEELAQLGETAMVEVARTLVGGVGALAVMGAGLLATLSSANASILSSSRAIYALSNDAMLPEIISRVNARFGTPHVALLLVGLPIAGFTLLGRIEILAEVASLLHLIIYGMICVSLIALRRRKPLWYAPTFHVPGGYIVPVIGAVASFGLIFLMEPLSLAIGGGVLALSLGWYFIYARETDLPSPQPPHIVPALRHPRILVPVAVPEPTSLPKPLLNAFQRLELLILGYKVVPEQTSPEQSRQKFGEEAEAALDEMVEALSELNVEAEHNLVFTPNFAKSVKRYVDEQHCNAVLTAKPLSALKRLVVPIYHQDQINNRLGTILRDLSLSSRLPITLAVMSSQEQESENIDQEARLEGQAIAQFERSGLPREQIEATHTQVSHIAEAVKSLTEEEDLVILAESGSSDRSRFFNTLHDEIESAVSCPILVILRQQNHAEDED